MSEELEVLRTVTGRLDSARIPYIYREVGG
jgi:hypothetical protein